MKLVFITEKLYFIITSAHSLVPCVPDMCLNPEKCLNLNPVHFLCFDSSYVVVNNF